MAGVETLERGPEAAEAPYNPYHIVIQKFPRVPISGLVEMELDTGAGLDFSELDPIVAEDSGNGDGDPPKKVCIPVAIGPTNHTYA